MSESNSANLVGEFRGEFIFDYTNEGERFYKGILAISRQSGTVDYIPISVPEAIAKTINEDANKKYKVQGLWASYIRQHRETHQKMKYYVIADSIEEVEDEANDENEVYLRGHVYEEPFFKITQNNGRKIANIMVKSKEGYLLPCIAWGGKAEFASHALKVGNEIEIFGRIQSRRYFKVYPDSQIPVSLMTYEISISTLAKL